MEKGGAEQRINQSINQSNSFLLLAGWYVVGLEEAYYRMKFDWVSYNVIFIKVLTHNKAFSTHQASTFDF